DLLLALGHRGPGELDSRPVLLGSPDGTTWNDVAAPEPLEVVCTNGSAGVPSCPAVSSYAVGASLLDGELLLAVQESVTDGPNVAERSLSRLRTGVYRAVDDSSPD